MSPKYMFIAGLALIAVALGILLFTDETGNTITIFKTEVVVDDDGMSIIVSTSPIVEDFGMTVIQFSVTGTSYDPDTRKQFAAKKASFLLTEQAKADREKETQERLMVIEKGLREKAEAEAIGNVAKIKAVIAAEQKAEVALQTKIEAETAAAQKLSVAELDKSTLLMAESAKFEQAEIRAKTASKDKEAMILVAQGKKEAIELSGAITELEEFQIRAEVDKATAVANAMSKIQVPKVMFISGGGSGAGGEMDVMKNMINYKLLLETGVLDKTNVNISTVDRKVQR